MLMKTPYETMVEAGLGRADGLVQVLPMLLEDVQGAAGDLAWIAANGSADRMELRMLAQAIARWTTTECAEPMRRLELRAADERVGADETVAAVRAAAEARVSGLSLEAGKLRAAGLDAEEAESAVKLLATLTRNVSSSASTLARIAAAGRATRFDLVEMEGAVAQRAGAHSRLLRGLDAGAPLMQVNQALAICLESVWAALGVPA